MNPISNIQATLAVQSTSAALFNRLARERLLMASGSPVDKLASTCPPVAALGKLRGAVTAATAKSSLALLICALLSVGLIERVDAQQNDGAIPDLSGVWDGSPRARPINGPNMPWTEDNFPQLNARALAYQQIWEEIIAPKYDCQPASSPAIQYDPYNMEVTQWPDRVLFRYEKDDQLRTVWLDGRQPEPNEFSVQGFSTGYYEDGALIVTTTNFVFDIVGFDDYNGIPSSSQKIVRERYWRDGDDLWITLEVEDPMFLEEPTSYTARWIPASDGYKLLPYDCDPEASRGAVRFFPSRYD